MSEKQKLIKEILELQRKFIAYEHEHGLDPAEYYLPDENHPLHGYRQRHAELARKLVDLAHQEKGSNR